MSFDIQQPKEQRTYLFQTNVFEDFCAAHIDGPIASEARAIWTSGGYIHFKRAIFYNVRVAAAGMPELSSGCFRILDESPPGFVMAFTESLFISGPFSETFFQLYDGGIQVLHSRWIFGEGTRKDFAVAKPKCAFGGNGNPVYLLGSRPLLPKEAAHSQRFAWAKDLIPLDHGLSISRPDSFQAHLANFQCIAWASPYINGSYLYFADGLGDTIPTIIAPAKEAMDGMQRIRGEERCAKFLQRRTALRALQGRWANAIFPLRHQPALPTFGTKVVEVPVASDAMPMGDICSAAGVVSILIPPVPRETAKGIYGQRSLRFWWVSCCCCSSCLSAGTAP